MNLSRLTATVGQEAAMRLRFANPPSGLQRRKRYALQLLVWLLIPFGSFALAQTVTLTEATRQVQMAVYQANATQEAIKVQMNAQLRERTEAVDRLDRELRVLRAESAGKSKSQQREIDALANELAGAQAEVERMLETDRSYREQIKIFRREVTDIANDPERLKALQIYNEGRPTEALAILDQIDAALSQAERRTQEIKEGERERQKAVLANGAIGRDGITVTSVINRYERVVTLDETFQDVAMIHWLLLRLGKYTESLASAERLLLIASNAAERARAHMARADSLHNLGQSGREDLLAALNSALHELTHDPSPSIDAITAYVDICLETAIDGRVGEGVVGFREDYEKCIDYSENQVSKLVGHHTDKWIVGLKAKILHARERLANKAEDSAEFRRQRSEMLFSAMGVADLDSMLEYADSLQDDDTQELEGIIARMTSNRSKMDSQQLQLLSNLYLRFSAWLAAKGVNPGGRENHLSFCGLKLMQELRQTGSLPPTSVQFLEANYAFLESRTKIGLECPPKFLEQSVIP